MANYIGLDLGGTNIKAGVVNDRGRVLTSDSVPTPGRGGPDAVIETMIGVASAVAESADVRFSDVQSIGIGTPGLLDYESGVVIALPNLPGWSNQPLRDRVEGRLGRPTVIENDANAAAFGEFWAGAGRERSIRHLVMLTLGTGIGSGVIIDGRVLHGGFNLGAEGGHMIVDPDGPKCACGQRGCVESFASAAHMSRRAVEALQTGERSSLQQIRDQGEPITAKDVFDAARGGDALARRLAEQTADYLAIGCINLCRLLDPQMIVFSGGMILAGQTLFNLVRAAFERRTWSIATDRVELVPARLGNDAGFIGAAAVAWDAHQRGLAG